MKRRFSYQQRASSTIETRLRSYKVDEDIRKRVALGDLIRAGAPFTDEQRHAMASMADTLEKPRKRGEKRKNLPSAIREVELTAISLAKRERADWKMKQPDLLKKNGELPDGQLDRIIVAVFDRLGDDGSLDGLRVTDAQFELMQENVRAALTHGKRQKARVPLRRG